MKRLNDFTQGDSMGMESIRIIAFTLVAAAGGILARDALYTSDANSTQQNLTDVSSQPALEMPAIK